MSDRSHRVKALFLEALEKQAPEEWMTFLAQACAGDAALQAEVETLLRAQAELGSFHEAPRATQPVVPDRPTSEAAGATIGPYKLLQQIGEGGMGTVWMAEQTRPVQRKVALKIIKAGMDTRQVIARFEAERQALALMDHANIAKVLDAGMTDAGRPFFVMELVKGQPITRYCDEHRLTPRQRLELFVPVCQAIQHAHQKGIIHRDIKPSNVLVAPYDGKPVVKVIDFGVAKATGQRLTEKTLFTEFGAVVGTLEYMSPEQAELNNQDIDTRSDIYSLGVLLYELLTGSTPLDRTRLQQAAFMEVLQMIREAEPPRPSTRLSQSKDALPSISAQRHTEPAKLARLVRGELDWIVMKALDKDRTRRYETANGLAMDLQRYLQDEPVLACPPSAAYRLRKLARRHKPALTAAVLVALVLVAGAAISVWQAIRATEAADAERTARVESQENLARATQAEQERRDKLWDSYLNQARALRRSQVRSRRLDSLQAVRNALQMPLPAGRSLAELRNEAASAMALLDLEVVRRDNLQSYRTNCVAFDEVLDRYARWDDDGSLTVCRIEDNAEIVRMTGLGRSGHCWLSPDGQLIAILDLDTSRLKIWRIGDRRVVVIHEQPEVAPGGVGFSPDCRRLVCCQRDGSLSLVTLADRRVERWLAKRHAATDPQFRPDGRQVTYQAQVNGKPALVVCDAATGEVQVELEHPSHISWFAWHPHSQMAASACDDLRVRVWSTANWQQTLVVEAFQAAGGRCCFSADGTRLLTNDWRWLLRVWDVDSGRPLLTMPQCFDMRRVARDGRLPVTDGQDGVELLRVVPGREFRTLSRRTATGRGAYAVHHTGLALRADARLLAATTIEGSCAFVDPATGRELAVIPGGRTVPIGFESSGALLTSGSAGLCRWPVENDAATGGCRIGPPEILFRSWPVEGFGSSADGRVLAIPNYTQGALLLHRDRPGAAMVLGPQEDVRACAVSPDGRWVATGNHSNSQGIGAKVWDAATGKLVKDLDVGSFCGVGFSPDSQWLVTTGGGCRVWTVGTWQEGSFIGKDTNFAISGNFAFSPDSRVLAVGVRASEVRLVEVATGREYVRLESPERTRQRPMCFTPDGGALITLGTETHALHVWDLRLIRRQLDEMGLDWDAPPYPAGGAADATPPLLVTVDLGDKK
jgi:serine/threonine protein kinase/WD40 repeat protein